MNEPIDSARGDRTTLAPDRQPTTTHSTSSAHHSNPLIRLVLDARSRREPTRSELPTSAEYFHQNKCDIMDTTFRGRRASPSSQMEWDLGRMRPRRSRQRSELKRTLFSALSSIALRPFRCPRSGTRLFADPSPNGESIFEWRGFEANKQTNERREQRIWRTFGGAEAIGA